jgi:hypothetical protein
MSALLTLENDIPSESLQNDLLLVGFLPGPFLEGIHSFLTDSSPVCVFDFFLKGLE